jgi:hypothetical protein
MTLHDTIESDAINVFCNSDDFAESVTYYPRSGLSRCIKAVVFREQLAILPEDGDNVVPIFEVHVINTCTEGISSDELNLGGDMMEFAVRIGQQVQRRSITKLLGHDEGMLILECR